jgi:hypothetical protein
MDFGKFFFNILNASMISQRQKLSEVRISATTLEPDIGVRGFEPPTT